MRKRKLSTGSEVIEVLGGIKAVADLANTTYAAAWNWQKLGTFPPRTYAIMARQLEVAEGGPYRAPVALWRMSEFA